MIYQNVSEQTLFEKCVGLNGNAKKRNEYPFNVNWNDFVTLLPTINVKYPDSKDYKINPALGISSRDLPTTTSQTKTVYMVPPNKDHLPTVTRDHYIALSFDNSSCQQWPSDLSCPIMCLL